MRYLMNYNRDPMVDGFEGLFDDMMKGFGFNASAKVPAVDIREEDKQYVVEAEIPGYAEGDVDVNVDKHVLHIASKKQEEKKTDKKYLVKERVESSFERAFSLPEDVDESKITGSFKNGVLTVILPKRSPSRRRSRSRSALATDPAN